MRRQKQPSSWAVTPSRRKKIARFIRQRRTELNISQLEMMRALGYGSATSVADVERGRVGLPFKRIYQFADVLRLPRDEFTRFVIGGIQGHVSAGGGQPPRSSKRTPALTAVEQEVVDNFRRLPSQQKTLVRKQLRDYLRSRGKPGRPRRGGATRSRPRTPRGGRRPARSR